MNRTSRMGGFLHCDYVSVSSASSFFIHESSGYEAGWSTASAPWAQPLPSSHPKYTFLEITNVCAVGFFSKDLLFILAPELPVSVVLGPRVANQKALGLVAPSTRRHICKCRGIFKHAADQLLQLKIASAEACTAASAGDPIAADRQMVFRYSMVSLQRHIVKQLVARPSPLFKVLFMIGSQADIITATKC